MSVTTERKEELRRLQLYCKMSPLKSMLQWMIEWQEATGKLLTSKPETRQKGLDKLEDAKRRREEMRELIKENLLK